MGLWDKLKGELIDIIEWIDNSNGETISYRFERRDNEIKNGAKLTVRESQIAFFVNEGEVADVFLPGMYELKTENIPILSTLKGWKYGFSSPFKAEVYFVNAGLIEELKWGTPGPVTVMHKEFDEVQISSNGSVVIRVNEDREELKKFFKNVVKTDGVFTKDELKGRIRDLVVQNLAPVYQKIASESLAVDYHQVAAQVKTYLEPEFAKRGLLLENFNILGFEYDEDTKAAIAEGKKRAGEMRGVNKMGNAQNVQMSNMMKMGDAMKGAGGDGGSMMGNAMGAGLGWGMANQMMGQMNQQNNMNNGAVPPPLPGQVKFFVAVNGQQNGPYDMAQMQQMIQGGQLHREMLVWKDGMPAWTAAGSVAELSSFFGAVPPPLPPQ